MTENENNKKNNGSNLNSYVSSDDEIKEALEGLEMPETERPRSRDESVRDFISAISDMSEGRSPKNDEFISKSEKIGDEVYTDKTLYGVENKSFYVGGGSQTETLKFERGVGKKPVGVDAPAPLNTGENFAANHSAQSKNDMPVPPPPVAFVDEDKKDKKKKKWRFIPHKGDSVGEVLRKIVFLSSVTTLAVCICYFLNLYVLQPHLQKLNDDQVNNMMNTQYNWADLHNMYPDTDFPENMRLSVAQAYAENNDFVAWLEIDGLGFSSPVVQTDSNDLYSYYLKHSFYKKYSKYGCPYMSSKCDAVDLSQNTVIYAHNMEYDDLMFGVLEKYRDKSVLDTAGTITLETMYDVYEFEVFAVFVTSGIYSDSRYFNYLFADTSESRFEEYLRIVNRRKLYDTGVEVTARDKLITLSTCTYDYDDARLVVVGKMK